MALDSHPLWLSLMRHSFDDPAHAVPFSERLRREQDWSPAFTSRVLREYRRFLFLSATRGELMVPSDAVDQAWHLHMLDTRAYWEGLCARILGRALHHTPSRGGRAEDARHASAYDETLRHYRETFGDAPPKDIWPSAAERFAGRYRRVDVRKTWLVRKAFASHAGGAALVTAILGGCAKATASSPAATFVVLGLVVGVIAIIVWAARQAHPKDRSSGSTCGTTAGCGCPGDGGGCGSGCGSGGCGN